MTQIRDLTTTTAVASGDLIPIASSANGVDMKMSVNQLITYFASNFANPTFTVQTASPTSGSTTTVTSSTTNTWLLFAPAGTLATATIALPAATSAVDGTVIIVNSSQEITALTATSTGASVSGKPAGLRAGESLTLRYNTAALTWYCVASTASFFSTATVTTALVDANGNEQIKFGGGLANSINEITVSNAMTGNGPTIAATGNDTNVGLTVAAKGSGVLTLFSNTGNILLTSVSGVIQAGTTLDLTSFAVKQTSQTVASLPTPASEPGGRRVVNNATATFTAGIGAIVAGGGANIVPVFSDGTNWRIG